MIQYVLLYCILEACGAERRTFKYWFSLFNAVCCTVAWSLSYSYSVLFYAYIQFISYLLIDAYMNKLNGTFLFHHLITGVGAALGVFTATELGPLTFEFMADEVSTIFLNGWYLNKKSSIWALPFGVSFFYFRLYKNTLAILPVLETVNFVRLSFLGRCLVLIGVITRLLNVYWFFAFGNAATKIRMVRRRAVRRSHKDCKLSP